MRSRSGQRRPAKSWSPRQTRRGRCVWGGSRALAPSACRRCSRLRKPAASRLEHARRSDGSPQPSASPCSSPHGLHQNCCSAHARIRLLRAHTARFCLQLNGGRGSHSGAVELPPQSSGCLAAPHGFDQERCELCTPEVLEQLLRSPSLLHCGNLPPSRLVLLHVLPRSHAAR